MRPSINAQGSLQDATTGLFRSSPTKRSRQEMQVDLQIYNLREYHGNASFSEIVLYLPVREYSSTRLQRSFALERPTHLGSGRWPLKKTRTCLVLKNYFPDRKSRCTINHAKNAFTRQFIQMDNVFCLKSASQDGGSVSRVNIGRLIPTSVTSRHTSMFFKMAGNFLVRHFC